MSKGKKKSEISEDAWHGAIMDYLENSHASLFGRAFSVTTPKERKTCADWLAPMIVELRTHVDD